MEERKCNLDSDCEQSQVCLLNDNICVNPDDSLIGFELNKKVYYAKSVEEIEEAVQQFIAITKIDLDALKCTVGMNFESTGDEEGFDLFVGKTVNDLRKKLGELKEDPINIISLINTSDGSVYCENLEYLKRHLNQKLVDKNFAGFVYNSNLTEKEIDKLEVNAKREPKKRDYFSNFPLLTATFIICNNELIKNLKTVVYYIVKLTNIRWRDVNPTTVASSYHNKHHKGDPVHILIPVGDRRFYCDERKGNCTQMIWDQTVEKPEYWDRGFSSRKECKDSCPRPYTDIIDIIDDNDLDSLKKLFSKGLKVENGVFASAIIKGNIEIAKFLLERGANINGFYMNITPLFWAIKLKHYKIIEFLLDNGADVNIFSLTGGNVLTFLVQNDSESEDVLELLLSHKADINMKDFDGKTPLHYAMSKSPSIVSALIENNADVNSINNKGETPFFSAMQNLDYSSDIIKILLKNKADVNIPTFNLETPLYAATYALSVENVKLFILHGADINISNRDGDSPIDIATELGFNKITKILIDSGAILNIPNDDGKTVFDKRMNSSEEIKHLLDKKSKEIYAMERKMKRIRVYIKNRDIKKLEDFLKNYDIEFMDKKGNNCLKYAIDNYLTNKKDTPNFNIIKLILNHGANINGVNHKTKNTLLHEAVISNNMEYVEFLVKNGAALEIKNVSRETPLFCSARLNDLRIFKFLIDNGADINTKDIELNNVLHAMIQLDKSVKIPDFLCKNRNLLNEFNIHNETPLYIASEKNQKIRKSLLKCGADINTVGGNGFNFFHYVILKQDIIMVKYLIKNGADVNISERQNGKSPLHICIEGLDPDTVDLLIKSGANLMAVDNYNDNLLHCAVETANISTTKLLANKGIDINGLNNDRETPLHLAVKNRDFEHVQFLVENGANLSILNFKKLSPIILAKSMILLDIKNKKYDHDFEKIFNYLFDKMEPSELKYYGIERINTVFENPREPDSGSGSGSDSESGSGSDSESGSGSGSDSESGSEPQSD